VFGLLSFKYGPDLKQKPYNFYGFDADYKDKFLYLCGVLKIMHLGQI